MDCRKDKCADTGVRWVKENFRAYSGARMFHDSWSMCESLLNDCSRCAVDRYAGRSNGKHRLDGTRDLVRKCDVGVRNPRNADRNEEWVGGGAQSRGEIAFISSVP